MDRFTTLQPTLLQPTVLHSSSSGAGTSRTGFNSIRNTLIGRLPLSIHEHLLTYSLAVPDIPAYARTCRTISRLVRDDSVWAHRLRALGRKEDVEKALGLLEERARVAAGVLVQSSTRKPAVLTVSEEEEDLSAFQDEFGDFASTTTNGGANDGMMDEFVGAFGGVSFVPRTPAYPAFSVPAIPTSAHNRTFSTTNATSISTSSGSRASYARAHALLLPLLPALSSPPHAVLQALFPPIPTLEAPSPVQQSSVLRLLSRFLSSAVQPVRKWPAHEAGVKAASERFESSMLAAFETADDSKDEQGMREAASAAWGVWEAPDTSKSAGLLLGVGMGGGEWEMGRVWCEKRGVFYEAERWRAEENVTDKGVLDFGPCTAFMDWVLDALREDGARAVRVFPAESGVLLAFAERLANEVIGEYISTLLAKAQRAGAGGDAEPFLRACAASFAEVWRVVDVLYDVSRTNNPSSGALKVEDPTSLVPISPISPPSTAKLGSFNVPRTTKKDDELGLSRTRCEDVVYAMFEPHMAEYLDEETAHASRRLEALCKAWDAHLSIPGKPIGVQAQSVSSQKFLASSNPAQAKRTFLASFTDALLAPVTIIPTAAGAAVQGLAMMNPARWTGSSTSSTANSVGEEGYKREFDPGQAIFELGEDDEDGEDDEKADVRTLASATSAPSVRSSVSLSSTLAAPAATSTSGGGANLDRLLSLDTALSLIHTSRESLKRVEAFSGYPAPVGLNVRDALAELFVLLLQALEGRHVSPGFGRAVKAMEEVVPGKDGEERDVKELVGFFELVHVGDTIASMVDVYYDKEVAPHIDRTDFMNSAVREKKRFEGALDDAVASGLNVGTGVLMNQVDHIIQTKTPARAYYPPDDGPVPDLGATPATIAALACLERHCALLKGSAAREVLEVFYQEIGFRLIAILQKHIKRQIISTLGGFVLIADLNAYHAFIVDLRVPAVSSAFAHLKMLAHVYVVADAPDLAQAVRDVGRYGGAYRPEDIYEFVQRRADWKVIEKTVDKAMYNLSFKEDCVVM